MSKGATKARLEAMYKGDHTPRRWGPGGQPRDFERSLAGRRTCRLSPEATAFLIDNIQGRNSKKPALIMIEPEGDIRLGGIQVFEDWVLALKITLDEGIYMYNARTKKCSRPVWSAPPEERTFDNLSFEAVRLVADQKTYDARIPRANTRLFAQEE